MRYRRFRQMKQEYRIGCQKTSFQLHPTEPLKALNGALSGLLSLPLDMRARNRRFKPLRLSAKRQLGQGNDELRMKIIVPSLYLILVLGGMAMLSTTTNDREAKRLGGRKERCERAMTRERNLVRAIDRNLWMKLRV